MAHTVRRPLLLPALLLPGLLTGLGGCADAPPDPSPFHQIQRDQGPDPVADALPPVPDAAPFEPFEPIDPADLGLDPEPAGYPALPATEDGADALPWLADAPELEADRLHFLRNTLARAGWLARTFADAEPGRTLSVGADLVFSAGSLLPHFGPEAFAGYVDALADVGANTVVVEIGPGPWTDDAGREALGAAFAQAEARGLAVHLRLTADPTPGADPLDFEGWRAASLDAVDRALAAAAEVEAPVAELRAPPPEHLARTLVDGPPTPSAWQGLLNSLCARAADAGASCAGALGFTDDGDSDWLHATLASDVQRVGAALGRFDDLYGVRLVALDLFLHALRTGVDGAPGRGEKVFLTHAWRPAFPLTFDRPVASDTAGLGCVELADADAAWLRAIFALARARQLDEVTLARNLGLFYLQGCQRTTRLYAAVAGPGGRPWVDFQQGNLRTDPLYWAGAGTRLQLWDGQLSVAGRVLRELADAAGR
ncbi:MAG: hypothetical protein H6702_17770 [Myxococcales bacterium]|nr:hypothetical protein [Myxococcales bacterium]